MVAKGRKTDEEVLEYASIHGTDLWMVDEMFRVVRMRATTVSEPIQWVTLCLLVALLLLASTLSYILRMPARSRLGDILAKHGRNEELQNLIQSLPQLLHAIGALRSGAMIGVVLAVVALVHRSGIQAEWLSYTSSFLASWAVVTVFGVALPGAWARYSGEVLLAFLLPLLHGLRMVMGPLLIVMHGLDEVVRRLSGAPRQTAETHAAHLEQQILDVVTEGEMRGVVDEEEKEMIESVIDLRDTQVEEIMTPRTDISGVEQTASLLEIKELIAESGHSRIPIYEETIDKVLGVIYAKDLLLLNQDDPFDVTKMMREALFIPETKLLRDLLHEFQERKVHIAVVLDEYGGTSGLVTFEDILEELVGEIIDEYEEEEPAAIHRLDDLTVEVDARMRIDDLNDELHVTLPEDEDYETIGGFVFSTLGKIPKVGERCEHKNIGIQIIGAEPRRVTKLRLHITPLGEEEDAEV